MIRDHHVTVTWHINQYTRANEMRTMVILDPKEKG
jgi:hypothetical protein